MRDSVEWRFTLLQRGRGDAGRHVARSASTRIRGGAIYIVGATGAGKSTLLLNLIHQDMLAGRGLTVIDVHGDRADAATQLVPKHRTNDTILFEVASEQVIPFNPLFCPDPSRVDQVTSSVVSAVKKLYDS